MFQKIKYVFSKVTKLLVRKFWQFFEKVQYTAEIHTQYKAASLFSRRSHMQVILIT